MTNPILITGMHRSHTSVISHWLHECGLPFLGELMPATVDNPKGYYENLDLVAFHNSLLESNQVSIYPNESPQLKITEDHINILKNIINSISQKSITAFKDPRACLFLENLWLPNFKHAFYIFIYRNPFEVVHSLMRRSERVVKNNRPISRELKILQWKLNKAKKLDRYVNTTLIYNQALIDAMKTIPAERYVCLTLNDCFVNGKIILSKIQLQANIKLIGQNINSIFEEKYTTQLVSKEPFSTEQVERLTTQHEILKSFSTF